MGIKRSNRARFASVLLMALAATGWGSSVFAQSAAMQLAKSWQTNTDPDSNGQITVGDTLTYWVRIQNTGSVTLNNVVVSDNKISPNSATCASVAPGLSCSLFGDYTVTPADETAGSIDNTGSATSTELPTPQTIDISTPVVPRSTTMQVQKSLIGNADGDGNGQVTVGDVLTYHVVMQNIGNQPINNVVLNDPITSPSSTTCATVTAGNTCVLIGTYTVTSSDASAGSINNAGTATSNEIPGPLTSTVTTPVATTAAMIFWDNYYTITTDADGNGQVTVGDTLTYVLRVKNSGSQPLTNVVISDSRLSPSSINCGTVAPGAISCALTGPYTVTAADGAAGSITNTGSATSTEVPGPVTMTITTPVVATTTAMSVTKALTSNADGDGNTQVSAGDVLTFTVTATNTGSVALTNVVVTDPLTVPASVTCASVALGASCSLVGTYTVTTANSIAGSFTNTGSAVAAQITTAVNSLLTTNVVPPVTAIATSLAIISGDHQTLAPGVASQPMVVQLAAGTTLLPGRTIQWTAAGGTLASATTVTDASGHASNTVTANTAGPVLVNASFVGTTILTGSSVPFAHNDLIADTAALTPTERSIASVLDDACAELRQEGTLSAAQEDLLDQCDALSSSTSPQAVAAALREMLPDVSLVQTQASQIAATAQFDNLNGRMLALRSGNTGAPLANLMLSGPGGMVPLAALGALLLAEEVPAAASESSFERWGFFASGSIGRGESDPRRLTPAYDFDISGITAGVDYRKSDTWVLGGAVGITRQDSTLAGGQGSLDTSGWSLSGYSTWYRGDSWYIDSLLSYGRNSYDHRRRISYTIPLGAGSYSVDQMARGSSDGSDLSAAATFGRDFHKGPLTIGLYGRGLYSRLEFDGFRETLEAGPGTGLGLQVADRRVTALSSVLGARFSYAHSASWGVLVPQADLEWQHEFRSDPDSFRALFVNDPTGTPILVTGDALDSSYFRLGVGLSMVMTRGRSGYFQYVRMFGRDGIDQSNLTLGFRIEF